MLAGGAGTATRSAHLHQCVSLQAAQLVRPQLAAAGAVSDAEPPILATGNGGAWAGGGGSARQREWGEEHTTNASSRCRHA